MSVIASRLHTVMVTVVTALGIFIAARIGLSVSIWGVDSSALWLASGIGISAILAFGPRAWFGVFIGAAGANVLALFMRPEMPLLLLFGCALMTAFASVIEAGLGALLFRELINNKRELNSVQDAFSFVGISLVMCVPSAIIGPLSILLARDLDWTHSPWAVMSWWLGNVAGVLVVAPLFLNWRRHTFGEKPLIWWFERLTVAAMLLGVCIFVFSGAHAASVAEAFAFAVFPPLIWAAFRFGQIQVAAGTAVVAVAAVVAAGHGLGPFVLATASTSLVAAQGFVWCLAVSTIAMAAAVVQRDHSENSVRITEQRLGAIYNAAQNVALVTTDLGGLQTRIVDFSPGAERLFGYPAAEMIGKPVSMLYPVEFAKEISGQQAAIRKSRQGDSYETTLLRRGGQGFPALFSVHPLFDSAGETVGTVEVAIDLSDLKRAEDKAIVAARNWIATFDAITDPTSLIDIDGRIVQANNAMVEFAGLSPLALKGRFCWEVVPGMKGPIAGCPFVTMKESLKKETYVIEDGDRGLSISVHPLLSDSGRLEGGVHMISDISEQRRKEKELAGYRAGLESLVRERTAELEHRMDEVEKLNRAILNIAADAHEVNADLTKTTLRLEATNKELEAFAYSVSHDLQAPLRHIVGFVEILGAQFSAVIGDEGQRYVRLVAESATRMKKLIDDLLSFSRAGRGDLFPVDIDLAKMVREVIREVSGEPATQRIEWVIGSLSHVHADRVAFHQVLVNLFHNAVKFSRNEYQPRIEVGQLPSDDEAVNEAANEAVNEVVIFIKDNGVGFDPAYAHKLFGVFQRLHRVDDFEGTGIGLANVRRIIARHGGRTWAEGQVDKGATFFLSLPKPQRVNGGSGVPL